MVVVFAPDVGEITRFDGEIGVCAGSVVEKSQIIAICIDLFMRGICIEKILYRPAK
jgi:hypothetical protein